MTYKKDIKYRVVWRPMSLIEEQLPFGGVNDVLSDFECKDIQYVVGSSDLRISLLDKALNVIGRGCYVVVLIKLKRKVKDSFMFKTTDEFLDWFDSELTTLSDKYSIHIRCAEHKYLLNEIIEDEKKRVFKT